MRIENTVRSSLSRSSGASRPAGGGFFVDDGAAAARPAAAQPLAQSSGIDALLALQAVEDPLLAKKKALRRGNALLDTLETIKADLLLGQVSEGRLNQLMALIGQARERNLPELDGVLDDIELRARVELAKFGRYPAG
ncbi:MAG: flagellar assembly protein FliX [Devosia sp.]|nr:flagellar assembly protein FliX [Devosia sp.]